MSSLLQNSSRSTYILDFVSVTLISFTFKLNLSHWRNNSYSCQQNFTLCFCLQPNSWFYWIRASSKYLRDNILLIKYLNRFNQIEKKCSSIVEFLDIRLVKVSKLTEQTSIIHPVNQQTLLVANNPTLLKQVTCSKPEGPHQSSAIKSLFQNKVAFDVNFWVLQIDVLSTNIALLFSDKK